MAAKLILALMRVSEGFVRQMSGTKLAIDHPFTHLVPIK